MAERPSSSNEQGRATFGQQQLARTPKSGWGHSQNLAPFVNPGSTGDSPIFLPVLPIEPSPTTGIQHMIPPLFHSSAARAALANRGEVLNKPTENLVPPPSTQELKPIEAQHKSYDHSGASTRTGKPSAANHDGWQWRKYGEKIVKGSPNPRSYYKCSHAGCCAKKIVERNSQGDILSTECKGEHSHPAPATVKVSRFRPRVKPEAQAEAPAGQQAALSQSINELLGLTRLPGSTLLPIPPALKEDEQGDEDDDLDIEAGLLTVGLDLSTVPLRAAPQESNAALQAAAMVRKVREQQQQRQQRNE